MSDDTPRPRKLQYHLEQAREQTSETLMEAYVEGFVTDEELDERLEMVADAESQRQLEVLIEDLPDQSTALSTTARQDLARLTTDVARRGADRPQRDTMRAIFGGVERQGAWEVAEILEVQIVLGGADLDFRNTRLEPGGITTLRTSILLGGVDIIVPPGVRVENQATPILGGVSTSGADASGDFEGSPHVLRIEGVILLGGIDVTVKQGK